MLDRERYIRFSLKTLSALRAELGKDALEKGFDPALIGKFLWYGLRENDPTLTVEEVEDLVDLEHLPEIVAVITKATGSGEPKQTPQTPAAETPPAAGSTEKKESPPA